MSEEQAQQPAADGEAREQSRAAAATDANESEERAPSRGAPQPPGHGTRSRTRRRWWLITGAGVVVLVAAAWVLTAAVARGQVTAWFDTSGLTCEKGTVTIDDPSGLDSDGTRLAAGDNLTALGLRTPGQHCVLGIQIRNDSPFPVSIGTLTYAGLGQWGGMRATYTVENGVRATFASDANEAIVDGSAAIGTIEPGTQRAVHLYLEHDPQATSESIGSMWWPGSPSVQVSVLGLGGTIATTGADWGFTSEDVTAG